MFTWFKNLFGAEPKKKPLVLTNPIKYQDEVKVTERPPAPKPTKPKQAKPVAKPKTQAKKPAPKSKKATVDLDSMDKTQLLAHAKANGIKANASLLKDEILNRIKNAK